MGDIVNGGAWLTVDGVKVDLIYRDIDAVTHWTEAAGDGRFEIRREVGYVAGIATYVLAGELAQGRLAAAGEWVLNEKRLVQRAGLADGQHLLGQPERGLSALVSDVRARLRPKDVVWDRP